MLFSFEDTIVTNDSKIGAVIYLSIKDCINCDFDKIQSIIKYLENNKITYTIVVKEKLTPKSLKILENKLKSKLIINLEDTRYKELITTNISPSILMMSNNKVLINRRLQYIDAKFINSILKNNLYLSASYKLEPDGEIIDISSSYIDKRNKEIIIRDNFQNKIFAINMYDWSVRCVYTLDLEKKYIESSTKYDFLKTIDIPPTEIIGYITNESSVKGERSMHLRTFYFEVDINGTDTNVYIKPSLIKISINEENTDEIVKVLPKFSNIELNFDDCYNYKERIYFIGQNYPECNSFPNYEVGDSTYILYSCNKEKYDNVKPLLNIKELIKVTGKPFYSVFQSDLINNQSNKLCIVNKINNAIVTLNIDNDSINNLKKIITKGELKNYYDAVDSLNLIPAKALKENFIFNPNSKYFLKDYKSDTNNIYFFLENTKRETEQKSMILQSYNFDGSFNFEYSYTFSDKSNIEDCKFLGTFNNTCYFLILDSKQNWHIYEFEI